MTKFRNRVALITGAGSGIGFELARRLSAEGCRVAALDQNAAGLDSLRDTLKGQAVATAVADVTDLAAVRQAGADLQSRLGPADLLIASAGIGRKTAAESFRAEEYNDHIRVNLMGVINSIDAVLPAMRERRSGHLVALSSVASYRGLPLMGGYCASKAGLNALLDALRVELAPLGIAVTTVCPAWVRTPMTATLRLPQRQILPVERAAALIVEAVRWREAFVAFPASMVWRVRLLRYLPRAWSDWLVRREMGRAREVIGEG